MILNNDEKYLIISPKQYSLFLYSLKEKNPHIDFKIISKYNFFASSNFSYASGALSYLLKKEKDDYLICKEILNNINSANLDKNKELKEIYLELEQNNLIEKDIFFSNELKQRKLILFELSDDKELINYLKRNKIEYINLTCKDFSDIFIEKDISKIPTYLFNNKLYQYLYIFSDIRKQIINNNVNPNDIAILVNDSSDVFYFNLCSNLFKIDIDLNTSTSIKSSPEISKFLDDSYNNKKFDLSNLENELLINIFKEYELDKFKDFDFAYLNLIEILSSYHIENNYSTGIKIIDRFDINYDLVYVTNFQYDVFYSTKKPSIKFSDEIMKEMELNPSYIKTLLDKNIKYNYLKYSSIAMLSRVINSSDEKIFDSQFITDKIIPNKYELIDFNFDGLYTTDAKEFVTNLQKDLFDYPKDNIYKSYDNSYKKIDDSLYKYNNSADKPFNASNLKSYFQCPFKYYVDNVLQVDLDNINVDKTNTYLGTFLHELFSNIYTTKDDNFDFEKYYQETIETCQKKCNDFLDVMSTYLKLSEVYIKNYYLNACQQKKLNPNIKDESDEDIEVKINFSIGKTRKYYLTGAIDKIIYNNEKKYYMIIDYKTTVYDYLDYQLVPFGGSLQLPLYYLGIKNAIKDSIFAGMYIHCIFEKKIRKGDYINFDSYKSKLNGITFNDIVSINTFDTNCLNSNKSAISGRPTNNFIRPNLLFNENYAEIPLCKNTLYTFNDLLLDTENAIINQINQVENNEFNISPTTKIDVDQVACKYCSYKDICYRRIDNINNLAEKIRTKFGTNSLDEGDKNDEV